MDSNTFRDFIETVRDANDIVAVVSADVDLKPTGNCMKGLSPLNPEHTPSFVVWPKSQTWKDYSNGSDIGGDVFEYVKQKNRCSFVEAVHSLAKAAGLRRPEKEDEQYQHEINLITERREIEGLLTKAADYYHNVLPTEIREANYQKHYGFTDETINKLKLGWSNGQLWHHFMNDLKVPRDLALKTGLFIQFKNGNVKDLFKNRLVFPYWKRGQVAYFIARATEHTANTSQQWEKPKYKKLLTHTDKHPYVSQALQNDTFYNEDTVYGAELLLITEGVTDCISAMQADIPCISPVTTRFRKRDIPKLIKLTRSAKQIIICNDSEENGAGEAGAIETAKALFSQKRDVRLAVIPRPEGKDKIDVNELVASQGPQALKEVINRAKRLPEFLIDKVPPDTASTDLDKVLEPVLEVISFANPLEKQAYQDILVERFGLKRRPLAQKLKDVKRNVFWLASKQKKPNERPKITVNGRQLRDVINDAKRVLVDNNERNIEKTVKTPPLEDEVPPLYVRLGVLSGLTFPEEEPPALAVMNEGNIFGALIRQADWYKQNQEGALVDYQPPSEVTRDILTYPPHEIPKLNAVLSTPVFSKEGKLIETPGLHRKERVWLQLADDLKIPQIPQTPTQTQIATARAMFLDEIYVDFPVVERSDWAHLMAATLLPFIRMMIKGRTPLHMIAAPASGSGKGLICNLISTVSTGNECDGRTLPGNDDEIRKMLTAELCKARSIILLDNAKERTYIDSPSLASVLTAKKWTDRILGKTDMITLDNNALWLLTGNNPSVSMELARRIIRIRIDPKQDQAWRREGFKHEFVVNWASEHRSELVYSALTLCQAWIAEGCPLGSKSLGSFEHWASVMDGLLNVIGVKGFLGNLDSMYEQADAEGEFWRDFVSAWWNEFGAEEKTITELNDFCEERDLMATIRGDRSPQSQKIRLGNALKSARDRVYGELRITLVNDQGKHHGRRYGLKPINQEEINIQINNQVFENQFEQEEIDPWQ